MMACGWLGVGCSDRVTQAVLSVCSQLRRKVACVFLEAERRKQPVIGTTPWHRLIHTCTKHDYDGTGS